MFCQQLGLTEAVCHSMYAVQRYNTGKSALCRAFLVSELKDKLIGYEAKTVAEIDTELDSECKPVIQSLQEVCSMIRNSCGSYNGIARCDVKARSLLSRAFEALVP